MASLPERLKQYEFIGILHPQFAELARDCAAAAAEIERLTAEGNRKDKLIDLIKWIVREPAYDSNTRCMARISEELKRFDSDSGRQEQNDE